MTLFGLHIVAPSDKWHNKATKPHRGRRQKMSVQRHEFGAKGGVFRDPMTWTKNADGSYHIVITTRRVGTRGQVLTYEYDWPSIPVSHTLAVATAERMWQAEHPAPKRTASQAKEAAVQGVLGFGVLSVIVSVLAFINAALGGPSLRVAIVSLAIGVWSPSTFVDRSYYAVYSRRMSNSVS
jgi:hypothetical protein